MRSRKTIRLLLMATAVIAAACLTAFRFYRHEQSQNRQLQQLTARLEEQEALLAEQKKWISMFEQSLGKTEFAEFCTDEGFDYLAIGNSITIHGVCDYWWEEYGMAASSAEKDYFHLTAAWLEERHETVNACAMDYSVWEVTAHDRVQTYSVLIPYLNEHIDLITLQLGENAPGLETFEKDFEDLLSFLAERCPAARILVIGDFGFNAERNGLKDAVTQRKNMEFIDLQEIVNDPAYQSAMGEKVYDSDGSVHIIEHEGVASHPGDAGMAYIASEIIKTIQESE